MRSQLALAKLLPAELITLAVYLHSDGSGNGGYASWATDWWWFGRYWLGAW